MLVNGDAEALLAHDFRDGQGAFSIGVHRVWGVEVERDGIKDCRADSFFFEVFHQSVALIALDGELVPDMIVAFVSSGKDEVSVFEGIEVVVGDAVPVFVPVIETGDFADKDSGLEFSETRGVSDFVVVVAFAAHSVNAEAEAAAMDFIVVGEDHSTVASGTKVLRDVKTDPGCNAEVPGVGSVVVAVDILCGVFEDKKVVLLGDCFDRGDVGKLSEEVDGENCFGFWGDGGFDLGGINAHRFPVDVDENGDSTELDYGFGGRNKSECGCDDLVSRADVTGLHGDAKCIGAAVDADGVLDTMAIRYCFL